MTTRSVPVALLCAALAAGHLTPPAGAQTEQAHPVTAVVIVRCPPGDLVLNRHLVDALLKEAGLAKRVGKALGDESAELGEVSVGMPGEHGPGTYQLHISTLVGTKGEWSSKRADRATDAILKHLRNRLDALIYEEPRARLRGRQEQLRRQFAQLEERIQQLRQAQRDGTRQSDQLRADAAAVADQLLQARVELSTETEALRHLAQLRDLNTERRDRLRAERAASAQQITRLRNDAMKVTQEASRGDLDENRRAELRDRLDRLTAELRANENEMELRDQMTTDVQGVLTAALEQLPQCELKLQRARARADSLEQRQRRVEQLLVQQRETGSKLRGQTSRLAELEIDLEITREQIIETRRRLARLAPVAFDVVRTR